MLLRSFIFDLDGTLVDSNDFHVEAWDRAFRRFGKEFPRDQLRRQIGKGSDQYLPEFLAADEISRFGRELDKFRSQLFQKEYLPRVRPFPKVQELFERITRDDKSIALATSGKRSETKYYTKLLRIDHLIAGQATADDAQNSKPAPDILTAALAKLPQLTAVEALVVGDTRFDIEAADKGGFPVIAFTSGGTDEGTLRDAGAIAVFRDPEDLLSYYEALMTKLQEAGCAYPKA